MEKVELSGQLGWTHFRQLIYLKEPLQGEFYAELCRLERWSTRTLAAKIQSMLYERTALSRKPGALARQELQQLREEDRLTPDLVFRDPYALDFLGLRDTFSETDLEAAILRELQGFLSELGTDFAFIARQKRITIGGEDHYLDLLFCHRRLRRLVVVDLKLERFQAADKGQMELYLRWLAKHERQPHEEAPLGAHPLRQQIPGVRRTAGTGKDRHPDGGVPHRAAPAPGAQTQAARTPCRWRASRCATKREPRRRQLPSDRPRVRVKTRIGVGWTSICR